MAETNVALAETMAIQALFVGLCHGLMKASEQNVGIIKYAFEYADHVTELGAYKFGSEAAGPQLTSVAKILEELRAAVVPDHGEPKSPV